MQVLSSGVETVSGCGWRWEAVGQVTSSEVLQDIKIHDTDVFQRIMCGQEMDISAMYGNITCQKSDHISERIHSKA